MLYGKSNMYISYINFHFVVRQISNKNSQITLFLRYYKPYEVCVVILSCKFSPLQQYISHDLLLNPHARILCSESNSKILIESVPPFRAFRYLYGNLRISCHMIILVIAVCLHATQFPVSHPN